MRIALITGITGQDGSYLAELLLSKGYTVYGTYRPTSSVNFWRIEELGVNKHPGFHLVEYDRTDSSASMGLLQSTGASEVYNLAAQSSAVASLDLPAIAAQVTGMGALNLLEAIRIVNPAIRFFQASSSEMFGIATETPQVESTSFCPRSPYGCVWLHTRYIHVQRGRQGLFLPPTQFLSLF